MLPLTIAAAAFAGLSIASPAAPDAAPKCVNGTKTYHINFDKSSNGFPTTANLTYNEFTAGHSKAELCYDSLDPTKCNIAAPQSGSYCASLLTDSTDITNSFLYNGFNRGYITNLPPNFAGNPTPLPIFALESFYFACAMIDDSLNTIDAPCTLLTVSSPIYSGTINVVTSSHVYPGNGSGKMQQVVLGDAQTNTVFLTIVSGTARTAILLDSLVVKTPC